MEVSMIYKLIRTLFGYEAGRDCRRCREPIHPKDAFGLSESVCLPCRLDPGRAWLSA
jgi:hypothetical protein